MVHSTIRLINSTRFIECGCYSDFFLVDHPTIIEIKEEESWRLIVTSSRSVEFEFSLERNSISFLSAGYRIRTERDIYIYVIASGGNNDFQEP